MNLPWCCARPHRQPPVSVSVPCACCWNLPLKTAVQIAAEWSGESATLYDTALALKRPPP